MAQHYENVAVIADDPMPIPGAVDQALGTYLVHYVEGWRLRKNGTPKT